MASRRPRNPFVSVAEVLVWLLFFALLVPAGVVGWAIGHSTAGGTRTVTQTITAAAAPTTTTATAKTTTPSPSLAATTKVAVTAGKPTEFTFTLSKKRFVSGTVVFTVANKGKIAHTFKVCSSPKGGTANACTGMVTKLISPSKSAKLTIVFKQKGTYEYLCAVPGHAAAGMKGDLTVT